MLFAVVLGGFLAVPWLYGLAGCRFIQAVAMVPLALLAAVAVQVPAVWSGATVVQSFAWVPSLGIDLSLRADGLSLLFALLITGIGSCVFLYASSYLADDPGRRRFFVYLGLFMASMLGAVLADNLVLMLVFWELTSLTSFLLMGYSHQQTTARRSAQQGLLVTVLGGLALTAGVLWLGQIAGGYSWEHLLDHRQEVAAHPWSAVVLVLIVLAALTKSAQVPFHFWLPNAMVAPTPVSAYLHSATMVKLGVYLLARFDLVFTDHAYWMPLLGGAGMATMVIGSWLLFRQTDLKRVLAYSTLTALGTLVLMIGLPGPQATTAMVVFLIVHAFYKACLFLVAGAIDHACGTRDVRQISGLLRSMPLTAAAAIMAGLSMAGVPPLLGFIGKELLYEAGLTAPLAWLVVAILVFTNAVALVAAGLIAGRCFFGRAAVVAAAAHDPARAAGHDSARAAAHDPGWAMTLGPLLLGALGLGLGLTAAVWQPLVAEAVGVIAGQPQSLHLALWHGWGPPLMLSLVTLGLGLLLVAIWNGLNRRLASIDAIDRYGCDAGYDRLLSGLAGFSSWLTGRLQSGSLASYLRVTVLVFAGAMLSGLLLGGGVIPPEWGGIDVRIWSPPAVLAWLLIVAAIAVARSRSFLAGIAAAGIVGFLMALVFLFQGAPDLAFTQFAVEALAVVIILLIVGRMPMHGVDTRTAGQRRTDWLIASALGVSATALLLAIVSTPFSSQLSDFYQQASYSQAHGKNIVNVIIVDFRGLDTLGEITVLCLAAVAALTLARRVKESA